MEKQEVSAEEQAFLLKDFCRGKDYLVCVDADGCAMNTMESRHRKCYGPCLIEEWALEEYREQVQRRWEEINLYTVTRGVNRFVGLLKMLRETDGKYRKIEGLTALEQWVAQTEHLSEEALAEAAETEKNKTGGRMLKKALHWSRKVNEMIERLEPADKYVFEPVRESLKATHDHADVVAYSSSNPRLVRAEWEEQGLVPYADLLLTREVGSKADCIQALLKKGYASQAVMIIGDVRGDLQAAEKNGVLFYPVLAKQESESWRCWREETMPKFLNHAYSEEQDYWIQTFFENLSGK